MRGERDASKQISRLAVEQPAAVEAAGSYLLLCNADLSSPLRSPSGDDSLRVGVVGKRELAEPDRRAAELPPCDAVAARIRRA